jgi:uncharacterized protein YndB with AHSA1/START domain
MRQQTRPVMAPIRALQIGEHGTFTVQRIYSAKPQRVYDAWASESAKRPWFADDDDFFSRTDAYTNDFRVGGHERLQGTLANGRAFAYDAIYQDIVEGELIVASYDVSVDGQRTSVSLMTIVLAAADGGTRLILTEQGAFLDGLDSNDQRVEGATDMLEKLGKHLAGS